MPVFRDEKSDVSHSWFSQFVVIIAILHFAPLRPHLEFSQYALHESFTSYRYALSPFRLSNDTATVNGFFNPLLMAFTKLCIGSNRCSAQPSRGGRSAKRYLLLYSFHATPPGSSNYKDKSWFAALTRLVLYVMRGYAHFTFSSLWVCAQSRR